MKVKDVILALQKKNPEKDVLMMLMNTRGGQDIAYIESICDSEYIDTELIEGNKPCVILVDE